jgi:hypothetical protein
LSDNASSFTSEEYTRHLSRFAQVQSFAGVGAHHHNGIAERTIQTIMSAARTMMLHAAIHWPDVADPVLWPLAVQHAVFLHNLLPNPSNGLSPYECFTKTKIPTRRYQDLHPWGCPTYVLDSKIADGKKIPRWMPRSKRQVFVGFSPLHASSIPLVLNLETGAITPQFHVMFDDAFSSVSTSEDQLPDFNSAAWYKLFGDSEFQYVLDDADVDDQEAEPVPADEPPQRANDVAQALDLALPPVPLPVSPPARLPVVSDQQRESPTTPPPIERESTLQPPRANERDNPIPTAPLRSVPPPLSPAPPTPSPTPAAPMPPTFVEEVEEVPYQREPPTQSPQQRERRVTQPPSRLSYNRLGGDAYFASYLGLHLADFTTPPIVAAYKAAQSDPDTLTYEEAMKDSDREKWMEAATEEVRALESKDTWVEVPMTEAKGKILPGTWVFRRKRTPDGRIKKYKGRYCVRGDLQEEVFDTFAPVVAWSTVRIFLILSMQLEWPTVSIDFSNAFVQAPLRDPVWIHFPRGFHSTNGKGYCLRLKKSLYGLTVAPKLWHEHLFKVLLSREFGFQQSSYDPCLLFRHNMMVVVYVDDAGVAAPSAQLIDEFVASLRKRGFELQKEGSFSEFLGIKFERDPNTKTITLTQRGLIDKIIQATGLGNCRPNVLPASILALGSDPEGEPMIEIWSYPSIVGMLLYLSTNTRPDISFAVSQVARFSSAPKQVHATAIKTLVRYLSATKDKGLIIEPTTSLKLEMFVDADFAGLYKREIDSSPNSARSRTGYVIKFAGCPAVWKSQLQTEISLSTLEAEYSALSYALRTLLPLKSLIEELSKHLTILKNLKAEVRAEVFEDNQSCYYLATNHRLTNRTKYFHVKYHWFWRQYQNGTFKISQVRSELNDADYFTKQLPREVFEKNRFRVQGW